MNRPIRVMAIGCLVLFLALMVNANYVQFLSADELNAKNGNRRVLDEEFSRERGPILVGGREVAKSVESGDQFDYQREYTLPEIYSNVTGYYSYLYGRSGIENSQNSILSGSDPRLFVNRVIDLVGSTQPAGGSVSLTINDRVQQAGFESLTNGVGGEGSGAAVAIDPRTGAILALVNIPGYNPNVLASHDLGATGEAWKRLNADPAKPLLDKSRADIFPPGSTFKLVTAAAALSDPDLNLDPDSVIKAGPTLSFPGIEYQLTNDVSTCDTSPTMTITDGLAFSCNTVFGRLALRVGAGDLSEQASRFGFGDDNYLDELTVAPSQFTAPGTEELDEPQTALSGIGQFEVATTPLQMAMVTAGIANDGVVMKPYIVDEVRSPDVEVLDRTEPEELHEAVSPEVAGELQEMMVSVVDDGTASGAIAVPNMKIGAKTGTAQSDPDRPPYAWFTAFAPADDPQIAVAVFIQDVPGVSRADISGGALAAPVAQAMLDARFGQ